ncbi:MAG TPA: signal recognition particle-docking protein FtsY [Bacillota bacterium]|nr:signal recognition particle-docking protein FtsY [Clostridiaceae bacterium]HNR04275.1 signal recognition particle-docking protein FtsY [Bacillota bacterium]HNT03090.1 signal recognition particle-docking protein FtsY [Bacillota bacterium]HPA54324.1 signal recognition particle-docking protein FtsY [Bacillota bacterium]HPX68527.1 signal recognition particle-docking protein FtsY [Bacillota bacterium]
MAGLFKKLFNRGQENEQEELQAEEQEQLTDEEIEAINEEEIENEETVENEQSSIFSRLKNGLAKTRNNITGKLNGVLASFKSVDEELFEELEEILITSDVGVSTTLMILDKLRSRVKEQNIKDPSEVKELLKQEILAIMGESTERLGEQTPAVILVIGVNGVGKTTSIGKIASKMKKSGKKVIIAAADTFRAAAIDQLEIWGKRIGVDVIKHQEGADPAAVIFDAINSAKSKKADILICDTAGRLHNKKNLMEELKKISRIIEREFPEAYKETLLVLDATTGQNAISQAKLFKEAADINGLVLTKLDGTAKGGIIIAIKSELDIPVKLIGVGEKVKDLQEFSASDFVNALFEEDE